MRSSSKKLVQKSIAVVVIVAILQVVGISPMVMLLATGIVFLVWVVNHRSQKKELEQIFDFYVAAEAILRDDDRRWYAFEVVEVIEDGERAFDFMPDCPALHLFALAALYHRIGKYEATAEYLGRVIEDEVYDERQNTGPSEQLRHYVTMLRALEANPSNAPQQLAAVRSLERMRRKHASTLLQESRAALKLSDEEPRMKSAPQVSAESAAVTALPTARPPISEVLHDVYHDDQSSLS
jgi:hypothetical protein